MSDDKVKERLSRLYSENKELKLLVKELSSTPGPASTSVAAPNIAKLMTELTIAQKELASSQQHVDALADECARLREMLASTVEQAPVPGERGGASTHRENQLLEDARRCKEKWHNEEQIWGNERACLERTLRAANAEKDEAIRELHTLRQSLASATAAEDARALEQQMLRMRAAFDEERGTAEAHEVRVQQDLDHWRAEAERLSGALALVRPSMERLQARAELLESENKIANEMIDAYSFEQQLWMEEKQEMLGYQVNLKHQLVEAEQCIEVMRKRAQYLEDGVVLDDDPMLEHIQGRTYPNKRQASPPLVKESEDLLMLSQEASAISEAPPPSVATTDISELPPRAPVLERRDTDLSIASRRAPSPLLSERARRDSSIFDVSELSEGASDLLLPAVTRGPLKGALFTEHEKDVFNQMDAVIAGIGAARGPGPVSPLGVTHANDRAHTAPLTVSGT